MIWRSVIASALLSGAACATLRGGGDECRPVTGPLPATASVAVMRGDFTLTLVASAGSQAGQTARGRLSLKAQDSALVAVSGATQPLIGVTDIALERVGAVRMGDMASVDPRIPGVAVYEQRGGSGSGPTVLLRLGSGSNVRDLLAVDAGHTTLYVQRIDERGFAGGWSSSTGTGFPVQESRGHFCAVKE